MADTIENGKYKGLTTERKTQIVNQSGTKVSSKLIFTNEPNDDVTLFDAANIDWSGYKIGETDIHYTGDLIENLGNVIVNGQGTNVTVDENNNSFNADGVQYTLTIDENGVLRFSNYTALQLKTKTNDYTDTLEYGQTNVTGGLTNVSVTCNKAFTGAFSSNDVTVSNNQISNFTLTATTNYTVNYNDNSVKTISATLTEVENTSNTLSVTIKVNKPNVKYKYAYILSDTEIDLNNININSWTKSSLCDGYPSSSNKISVNISGTDKYVYVMFLNSQNFDVNDNTFVYQSSMSFSGGMIETNKTYNFYSGKSYTIWRTTNKLTGNWNILFKK